MGKIYIQKRVQPNQQQQQILPMLEMARLKLFYSLP
jgi:hypothetical protein